MLPAAAAHDTTISSVNWLPSPGGRRKARFLTTSLCQRARAFRASPSFDAASWCWRGRPLSFSSRACVSRLASKRDRCRVGLHLLFQRSRHFFFHCQQYWRLSSRVFHKYSPSWADFRCASHFSLFSRPRGESRHFFLAVESFGQAAPR